MKEVVGFAQELLLSDWKIGKARPLRDTNYAARDWPMGSNAIQDVTSAVCEEVSTRVIPAGYKDLGGTG